ncbi:zinc ribbon domain-containing protein [Paraliobacillus sediminis]|uniref:zinc ribbon domain-containing protein n=1 Tax=Paraliobacillus sediminis TaxID=1885916 RepID=UPI000E3CD564|nr:zinc ribbon domain-containing protein [Paraliobacillus sediminis]
MKTNKICPECGSKEVEVGEFKGYGSLFKRKAIIKSSEVDAYFCVNCGYVLTLKVRKPEKFL